MLFYMAVPENKLGWNVWEPRKSAYRTAWYVVKIETATARTWDLVGRHNLSWSVSWKVVPYQTSWRY